MASPMMVLRRWCDQHLLGDVRRRVVHDDGLGVLRLRHAEAIVRKHAAELRVEMLRPERQIDEARSRHRRRRDHVVRRQALDQRRRDVARALAQRARERERGVGLVVGVRRAMDGRIDAVAGVAERLSDGVAQALAQGREQIDAHRSRGMPHRSAVVHRTAPPTRANGGAGGAHHTFIRPPSTW